MILTKFLNFRTDDQEATKTVNKTLRRQRGGEKSPKRSPEGYPKEGQIAQTLTKGSMVQKIAQTQEAQDPEISGIKSSLEIRRSRGGVTGDVRRGEIGLGGQKKKGFTYMPS